MVGPMSPAARLKKSDDLGLGSQHLSTRAKWRLGKVKSAIRRGVAQIRLTPGIVVRDRTDGGALRSATEALLSSPGDPQKSWRGQGGRGPEVGHADVPDVARGMDVRATESGGHVGEPESFCGRRVSEPSP